MKKIVMSSKPSAGAVDRPSADQWVNHRLAAEPIKRLTIDVPQKLHRRIKSQCATRSINMADEIRKLLEAHFPESAERGEGRGDQSPAYTVDTTM